MDRSIDALDTPMARHWRQQRAQALEEFHYEDRMDRKAELQSQSQQKRKNASDKSDKTD
jgi:hypothetical protein